MSQEVFGTSQPGRGGAIAKSAVAGRRKDRRSGSRINRVAPRNSRLQVVGLLATIFSLLVGGLVVLAALNLEMAIPLTSKVTIATLLALSMFILALGSVEQRLIEIRLELMMLNGGQRRADRGEPDGSK